MGINIKILREKILTKKGIPFPVDKNNLKSLKETLDSMYYLRSQASSVCKTHGGSGYNGKINMADLTNAINSMKICTCNSKNVTDSYEDKCECNARQTCSCVSVSSGCNCNDYSSGCSSVCTCNSRSNSSCECQSKNTEVSLGYTSKEGKGSCDSVCASNSVSMGGGILHCSGFEDCACRGRTIGGDGIIWSCSCHKVDSKCGCDGRTNENGVWGSTSSSGCTSQHSSTSCSENVGALCPSRTASNSNPCECNTRQGCSCVSRTNSSCSCNGRTGGCSCNDYVAGCSSRCMNNMVSTTVCSCDTRTYGCNCNDKTAGCSSNCSCNSRTTEACTCQNRTSSYETVNQGCRCDWVTTENSGCYCHVNNSYSCSSNSGDCPRVGGHAETYCTCNTVKTDTCDCNSRTNSSCECQGRTISPGGCTSETTKPDKNMNSSSERVPDTEPPSGCTSQTSSSDCTGYTSSTDCTSNVGALCPSRTTNLNPCECNLRQGCSCVSVSSGCNCNDYTSGCSSRCGNNIISTNVCTCNTRTSGCNCNDKTSNTKQIQEGYNCTCNFEERESWGAFHYCSCDTNNGRSDIIQEDTGGKGFKFYTTQCNCNTVEKVISYNGCTSETATSDKVMDSTSERIPDQTPSSGCTSQHSSTSCSENVGALCPSRTAGTRTIDEFE